MWKIMLEIIQVNHQKDIKRKICYRKIKTMDKYAQIKRFYYEHQIQVYMYDLMYVDNETISEEHYFTYAKNGYRLQENFNYRTSTKTLNLI